MVEVHEHDRHGIDRRTCRNRRSRARSAIVRSKAHCSGPSAILHDEQLTGYVGYFRLLANSSVWQSITAGLGLVFTNFPEQGLPSGLPDRDVWEFCQANGIYLLTDNRNSKSADALEGVLRTMN